MNRAEKLLGLVDQDEFDAHFIQDVTSQLPRYPFQWKNLKGEIKYAKSEDELQKLIKKDRDEMERKKGKNKVEEESYPKIVKDGLVKSTSWVWNHSTEDDKKEFDKYLVDARNPLYYSNISRYHKYTTFMGKLPQNAKKKEMFSIVPLTLGTSKWV